MQDPAFRKAVKQRYEQLRKGLLSLDNLYAYIDRHAQLVSNATEHHFQTYPELLVNEEQKKQFEEQRKNSLQGGFPFGGGFPPMGGGFPPDGAMPDFQQFSMVNMFAAYRVCSYDEEVAVLKQWLADRLAFLDRNIARFDKDWQPRIQPLIEKKMQFPGGFPGGGFPGGGFPGGGFPGGFPPGGGFMK